MSDGIFIALLLGLLFIPPVLAFTSIFIKGIQIIGKELKSRLSSGRVFLVISFSKEHITLEPQVR